MTAAPGTAARRWGAAGHASASSTTTAPVEPARAGSTSLRALVLEGDQVLDLLGPELDALADECAASVTARSAWLRATAAEHGSAVWAVAVHDVEHGLRAAMVLLDGQTLARTHDVDPHGGLRHTLVDVVTLAGSSTGHCSAVLAADPASARLLGHVYWEALRARDRAVLTALGPVPAQDSALADLAAGFPGAEVVSGNAVPVVERQQSALATDYLSASMRRTLRKAANRSHSDGVRTTIGFVRDHDEIAALLPALEQLHRDRDHDQGRPSELDDPHDAAVWRSRLLALNEAGQLEVATLHIDSELAAHVIGVVDGDTYRVLEGVLASRFARYSPGRVLETAVLQHVLDQPELHTLDWVSSIASETLLAVSSALPTSVLRAALAAPGASTQPG